MPMVNRIDRFPLHRRRAGYYWVCWRTLPWPAIDTKIGCRSPCSGRRLSICRSATSSGAHSRVPLRQNNFQLGWAPQTSAAGTPLTVTPQPPAATKDFHATLPCPLLPRRLPRWRARSVGVFRVWWQISSTELGDKCVGLSVYRGRRLPTRPLKPLPSVA